MAKTPNLPRHRTTLVLWSDKKLTNADIDEMFGSTAPIRRVICAAREKVVAAQDPIRDDAWGDETTTVIDRDKERLDDASEEDDDEEDLEEDEADEDDEETDEEEEEDLDDSEDEDLDDDDFDEDDDEDFDDE